MVLSDEVSTQFMHHGGQNLRGTELPAILPAPPTPPQECCFRTYVINLLVSILSSPPHSAFKKKVFKKRVL